MPTIEDGYQTTVDGETVEIIDTAGLERFSHLRSTYMQVGDAFILVYSITSAASLLVLGPLHEELQELRNRLGLPKAHVQIVGTKADQVSTRQVSTRQCARIAMDAKLPLPIIETFSLKSDSTPPSHPNDASNVYIAFASLVRRHQEMRISAALDTGKLKTSQWCCIVS